MRRLLVAAILAACAPAFAEDVEGCKDHPLFNRMSGYHITNCETKDFDAREFPAGPALTEEGKPVATETIEGAQTQIVYEADDADHHASGLQIARNFQNAAKAAGGTVIAEYGAEDSGKNLNDDIWGGGDRATVLKFKKGGKEVWAVVHPFNAANNYVLHIAERQAMKQEVVANELLDQLNKNGYVALYINFDTGKSTIKADSQATLEQVAQMLKAAPELKIEVGGHTDDVGKADANQKLSEGRAQAVVAELTKRGIAAGRLTAKGYGQSKPVADNRTEEGRAKNRRVELVKK